VKKRCEIVEGFSLVEVALALGVASFCLLTLLALLPIAVQRFHDADAQSAMVNTATMVIRDLEATPGTGAGTSVRFNFSIPASGSTVGPYTIYVDASGNASGTTPNSAQPNSTSLYRASVYFTPPASGFTPPLRTATSARIWITFPAEADSNPATDAKNYADMFETTISLNRN
jgi:uncharacterized protein (TIGR02598 family)